MNKINLDELGVEKTYDQKEDRVRYDITLNHEFNNQGEKRKYVQNVLKGIGIAKLFLIYLKNTRDISQQKLGT